MATKWKNRLYALSLILLLTIGIKGILSGTQHSSEYFPNNYFQTSQFENYLHKFIGLLNHLEFNMLPEDELKAKITVSQEEIDEHRYRYGDLSTQIADIERQYASRISEAEATNSTALLEILIAERDQKIEDIRQNFASDDHVRSKIVKEKEQELDEFLAKLESYRPVFDKMKAEFWYYFQDQTSGKVYTNLNLSANDDVSKIITPQSTLTIRNYPSEEYGDVVSRYFFHELPYNSTVEELFFAGDCQLVGQIAVPKKLPATSQLLADYQEYQWRHNVYLIYMVGSALAVALGILLYRHFRNSLSLEFPWERFDALYQRMPFDLRVIFFILSIFITLAVFQDYIFFYYFTQKPYYAIWDDLLLNVLLSAAIAVCTLLQARYWYNKRDKLNLIKEEWQTSLLARITGTIRDAFLNRRLGTQMLLLLTLTFSSGLLFVLGFIEEEFLLFFLIVLFVLGLPMLVYTFKSLGYLGRIMHTASELAQGNFGKDLEVKGRSVFAKLAQDINTLKTGYRHSQREQAKSERLKTELITNVSHDLRTPLTSVITYAELLKTPGLSEEDRQAYIEIIDRKAKRLKILIDDLFEASKMASGNIELVKSKVDLVQLLQQALAERNDAIADSSLDFRISTPDRPVYAYVDGQKLWRAFDNLIGNILKYALENTRVYLSITTDKNQAVITFKNISKYELGDNIDELLERFKRGDTSRHTEGSGLGLAIAKSIIDLHDGILDLDLDGDLFKVTIKLQILES